MQVYQILDEMRIGTLPESERTVVTTDPYANDPKRSDDIVARTATPFNGESPIPALMAHVTPTELHFKRNHMPVPDVLADAFELQVLLPCATTTLSCHARRR